MPNDSTPNSPLPPLPPTPSSSQPIRVVIEQSRLSRVFSKLGWILFALALMSLIANSSMNQRPETALEEKYVSHEKTATSKIAVITIEGVIMTGEGFIKSQIDQVRKDPNVKAVVLRVVSPGGTINGSDHIYQQLLELTADRNIPLVVSMGSIAASGGYYVAMATNGQNPDVIFAERTTWTGSIGVIIPHYNVSDLLEKWDIKDDSIVSHPLKQMGSLTKKMPPEIKEKEQAILQGLVDESFGEFKKIVKAGRPKLSDDELTAVATGQVFTANQALKNGLIDKIGSLDDAINRAIELANLDKQHARAVKYVKPVAFVDALLGNVEAQTTGKAGSLTALFDLATPRAYYLFSWLPADFSSMR